MNYSTTLLFQIAFLLLQVPTGVVTGQVLSKEGPPAAGVRVGAVPAPTPGVREIPSDTIVASALTDDTGHYRLEGIPAGQYYITAGLVDMPSYYPGANSAKDAKVVSVAAGAVAANIDFVMVIPEAVRVSGRVIWPPGQAPRTIPLLVLVPSDSQLLSPSRTMLQTVINADGTFEFNRVRPGSYRVTSPSTPATLLLENQITVIDRDLTGIDIKLADMVDVTGRVVLEGGRAQVPLFPVLFAGEGHLSTSFVSSDGTLRLQLAVGEYRVTIGPLPTGHYVKSFVTGKTDLLLESLKLTAGTPREIVITLGINPETANPNPQR